MIRKLFLLALLVAVGYWCWAHTERVRRAARSTDDGAITAEILAKIGWKKPLALLSVRVKTEDGVVHLSGRVRDEAEEEEVEQIAKGVDGVRRVDDELSMKNAPLSELSSLEDTRITANVKEKLIEEEGLAGVSLHVTTEEGEVTLSGDVPSKEQAELAYKLAESVSGVKGVRSRVKVR